MKIENWRLKINFGFTVAEILVVVGIIAVISSISFYFFGSLSQKEVLEKDVASLTALVRNARLLSVASKNASSFGIHLENNKAVLFQGNAYVAGGPNEIIFDFSKEVYLSSWSLSNGGSNIVFDRLTGETFGYGTITLSLKNNSTSTVITVLKTGVVQ